MRSREISLSLVHKLVLGRDLLLTGKWGSTNTFYRLQEVPCMLQSCVCTVVCLRCESHGSTIATACLGQLIIRPRAVPRQAQQHWTIRSIVIVVLFVEPCGDKVVHLLVILLGWTEYLGCGRGRVSLGVEVETRATDSCGADNPGQRRRLGWLGRGGVEAVLALARVALPEGSSGSGGCEGAAGGEARGRLGKLAGGGCHVAIVMKRYQSCSRGIDTTNMSESIVLIHQFTHW